MKRTIENAPYRLLASIAAILFLLLAPAKAQSQIDLTDPDWVVTGFDIANWTGSELVFEYQNPTANGYAIGGYADWYSNGIYRGRELFAGTMTGNQLTFQGYQLQNPIAIQLASYHATVALDGFTIINGTWLGLSSPVNGTWSATRGQSSCALVTTYCTPGTSSNGCTPTLDATGAPSASSTGGFVLTVSGVEGRRNGVVFYGTQGALASPWGNGSSSFLCVQLPIQRGWPANSGGHLNQCDGTLSLDWNAFTSSYPGALGAPFGAGDRVWSQAWFRDPASPKSTSLSSAVTFVVCP